MAKKRPSGELLLKTKRKPMTLATQKPTSGRTNVTAADSAPATTLENIRAGFPALARKHRGVPIAYFDGPGGTQVPQAVVDAVADYLIGHNANTHWNYPTSAETDAIIASARETLADFV